MPLGHTLTGPIKNWHELMRGVSSTVEVINGIQKVSSTSLTPYKASKKFDIKKFLDRYLMVLINTTYYAILSSS